jgi:hypothetical protein
VAKQLCRRPEAVASKIRCLKREMLDLAFALSY